MKSIPSSVSPVGKLPLPVLLYILAVMLPINFDLGPISMTGVRLLLIVMIVPTTLKLFSGRYGPLLLTDSLFFLHFAWIAISLSVNNPNQVVLNAGSTGIEFIGGYILARSFIRSQDDFIALIRALVTAIVLVIPFLVYEAMTGDPLIINLIDKLPGIGSLIDIDIGKRLNIHRAQVVFVHPIHWGLFCAIVLPMCLIGMKGIYSDVKRITLSLLIIFAGLMALSSGALLAIFLQIGLFLWAWMMRNYNRKWSILVGLAAACYFAVDILSNRSPLMVFLSYATFSSHTAYWRMIIFEWGMVNVWANPVFGIGLNDWVRPSWMHSGSMDNFWLVIAVRHGIPGFLLLAIGYGAAIWRVGRLNFDTHLTLWQLRRGWVFSCIGLTFTICTVHVWHTAYSFVFFMFGAGMWMVVAPLTETVQLKKADGKGRMLYRRSFLRDLDENFPHH